MKKMMYLCPVDWRWIKQRPQFLAEELEAFYDIYAVYPYKNNRHGLQKDREESVKLAPDYTLPTMSGRIPGIGKLNRILSTVQIRRMLRRIKPDILWLSMPWQIDFIPAKVSCSIVYDCMDDYAAITSDPSCVEALVEQEKQLVCRADVIFASSDHLRTVLSNRHGIEVEKICLLRNGYNAHWLQLEDGLQEEQTNSLKIGYFGTVGRWFDFRLLLDSLEKYDQIEYHLFGPLENGIHIPEHERLIYRGVVEHDQIQAHAAQMQALMMPFIVNDIVRSVDPVKLYEYIWLNKNIICVRYPEIERFEPFMRFYRDRAEYMERIEEMLHGAPIRYTRDQAEVFLRGNNWKTRAQKACDTIENNRN